MAMVASFNSLELMIASCPTKARGANVRNTKELRGRMIHLLPVIDALEDSLYAANGAPRNWWKNSHRCWPRPVNG